jgi:hypothetical protein
MTYVLRSKLPVELVDYVKLFTGEGVWRNGKYINIHRIPKLDYRYEMLLSRPKIKQIINDSISKEHVLRGCTWFKSTTLKFVVINVRYATSWGQYTPFQGYYWEMFYDNKVVCMHIL